MPKPIQRKEGGSNLPPIETQMSPFSAKLSAMADQQKAAFSALSPNVKKLHDSIRDSERYAALIDPATGIIACLKRDSVKCALRMSSAVAGFNKLNQDLDLCDMVSDDGTQHRSPEMNAHAVSTLRVCGMTLATAGRDLSELVSRIFELENEAEQLEVKVMDDSNLPDFKALNDPVKQVQIDDMAEQALALVAETVISEMPCKGTFAEEIPEDAKPKPFCDDRPLYWESWYESGDKVVAPTKEGAQAMVAMRIQKTLQDKEISVWQVDENGKRICQHEYDDADGGPCDKCGHGGLLGFDHPDSDAAAE